MSRKNKKEMTIEDLANAIEDLAVMVNNGFNAQNKYIDKRFAEQNKYIDKRFAKQDKSIDKRFFEQDKYIDKTIDKKLDEKLLPIWSEIKSVREDIELLSERMDRLTDVNSQNIDAAFGDIIELRQRVDRLEKRVKVA